MIIPPKLVPGDRVAIVSPSGSIPIEYLNNAVNLFESWGLQPYVSMHAAGNYHIFSGRKDERLADLQQALDDSECKAIFCSRGGYGAIHLLEDLNPELFIKYPKWIVGFSDVTALHTWAALNGIASLHGDMPKTFPFNVEDTSLLSLKNHLFDGDISYIWDGDWHGKSQRIEGFIYGGNLSVLSGLNGTAFTNFQDDAILLIEDLNEDLYHLERMMYNLSLNGVLEKVKAILVGGFTDMKESDPPFGKTVEEIILTTAKDKVSTIIFNAPAGHQKPNVAIPLGVPVVLERDGSSIKLYT